MKYNCEIIINQPIHVVVKLFNDPNNLKLWMDGLESFETISGTQGEAGAKSRLIFRKGKRKLEMIETITVNKLPEEFSGTYEVNGIVSIINNKFLIVDENTTRYISDQEFQLKGFMKIIGFLIPGAFKKESQKHMSNFKAFAESNP